MAKPTQAFLSGLGALSFSGGGAGASSALWPPLAAPLHFFGAGLQQVGAGLQQVGAGLQQVGAGLQQVGAGAQHLGAGLWHLGAGLWHFLGAGLQQSLWLPNNQPASAEFVLASTNAPTTSIPIRFRIIVVLLRSRLELRHRHARCEFAKAQNTMHCMRNIGSLHGVDRSISTAVWQNRQSAPDCQTVVGKKWGTRHVGSMRQRHRLCGMRGLWWSGVGWMEPQTRFRRGPGWESDRGSGTIS